MAAASASSHLVLLLLGIALLLGGGTALVRGASGLARSFGISPMAIGLTVVAFGTSAPELVVNIAGALRGETEIAFGNVLGSNLANLGLVLGLAAIATPILIEGKVVQREVPLLLLGTSMLVILSMDPLFRSEPPILDRADGAALMLLFSIFIYVTATDVLLGRAKDPLLSEVETLPAALPRSAFRWNTFWTISGMLTLAAGANLTVGNGSALAAISGIEPAMVGMIVIAIGTSLPELVTSIIAAMRKEADLALGNVIGSNIFNSLFVLPISALIEPLKVPAGGVIDILCSFAFAAILIPVFVFGQARLGRPVGILLVSAYVAYLTVRAWS